MASTAKPTILFVHGAWHSHNHFKPIRELFEANGYPTVCPCLPSSGAQPPTTDMYEDAKCIRSEWDRLVEDEGKEVIVVMHWYGGVVGTEAMHESLGIAARDNRGLSGGALRLLYFCTLLFPLGESLGTNFGGKLPPSFTEHPDGSCTMQDPRRRFYNDLPEDEQDRWLAELKQYSPIAALSPQKYLAYKYHPVSYLFCGNDQVLPLQMQEMMVKDCGVEMQTQYCTAGHSPFLSQPEVILDMVKRMTV